MASIPLVLASASPARLATLRSAGLAPVVCVSAVDEDAAVAAEQERTGEALPATRVAALLARAKCEDVASRIGWGQVAEDIPEDALVLGCDSVLELDGEVHGKPRTPEQAVERWTSMRGRTGVLHTGHWLIDNRDPQASGAARGTGRALGATGSTTVHFADLSDAEIAAYVGTGEPLWVAGAFTVDGLGGPFVTRIEGDYHNVVGVSLPLVRELLLELGVDWFTLERTR